MAKAAIIDSSSAADILPLGRCQSGLKMKRKTPLELRGEQLKRKNGGIHLDEKNAKMLLSESRVDNGIKKPESMKAPRYINTRVNEVYPVRKSGERFRVLRAKDKVKDAVSNVEMANGLDNPCRAENITSLLRCNVGVYSKLESSDLSSKATDDQGFRKIEKCSQSALRNVVEIHLGDENALNSTKVDMEKALKGLVARDKSSILCSFSGISSKNYDLHSAYARKISPEFQISGHRAPLDFTLKTTLRLISLSSVKWCHRVNATPAFFEIERHSNIDQQSACTSGHNSTTEIMYSKAIHSWAFPQSSLPPSIIIAMTLSATKGDNKIGRILFGISTTCFGRTFVACFMAYHQDSISGVDNSPQSLLAFIGNTNVHGLYDFLLNYRSFLKSLNGIDVPALYAPVPFPNASLCIPEVKCREIKKADAVTDSNASLSPSETPICYSIEVKDTILPPWVICRLCAAMSADGSTFESIFTTEPSSAGLNIALESFCQKKTDQLGNFDASMPESGDVLGLPEAVLAPCLQSASLRRLKYCNGSYIAYITQI